MLTQPGGMRERPHRRAADLHRTPIMQGVGEQLRRAVDRARRDLSRLDEDSVKEAASPGNWSKKQILGHLIDSASNNHQRFVRAQLVDELIWPGYDQAGSVRAQNYQDFGWRDLVEFWANYNRFLAHVLDAAPPSKAGTICRIDDHAPMTLEELAVDYIRHLEHHLAQLTR